MELRDLQKIEFKLLQRFKEVCDENNLVYYISGGTYLGAVRHKGFIPWDDDIDVAMPREDYDKFVLLAVKEFEGDQKFWHYKFVEDSKRPNSRLVDTSVKIKNNSWIDARYEPVWIDIFPLDGLPKSKIALEIHKLKLLYLKMMVGFANFENIQNNKPNRPWHETTLIKINNLLGIGKKLDLHKQYDKLENTLRKYSKGNSDVYFNFHGAYRFNSIFQIKEIYGEGIFLKFESDYFRAPKSYDKYLTQIYGDYMKLPPIENRNKHNTEVVINE